VRAPEGPGNGWRGFGGVCLGMKRTCMAGLVEYLNLEAHRRLLTC